MEKSLRQYGIFLKRQILKPTLWLGMVLLMVILYFIKTMAVPANENVTVLIHGATPEEEALL